jgi:hypothetical protein
LYFLPPLREGARIKPCALYLVKTLVFSTEGRDHEHLVRPLPALHLLTWVTKSLLEILRPLLALGLPGLLLVIVADCGTDEQEHAHEEVDDAGIVTAPLHLDVDGGRNPSGPAEGQHDDVHDLHAERDVNSVIA